ncbi:hypothetical protein LT493_25495 [Streptomyces tricolor]|nr:hypothetical protein [Streptomyces tricolor]
MLGLPEGSRFQVLSPWSASARASSSTSSPTCRPRATSRARVDGQTIQLSDPPTLKKQEKHTIEVVVDRLTVKDSAKRRLTDSVESRPPACPTAWSCSTSWTSRGRSRSASACTRSTCTARTTTCPSRSWSPAPSPSTRPSAPAPSAPASARAWRSTRS